MPRYQRLAQIIRSGTSATRHLRGLPWATAWRTALFWARVKRSNPDTWLLDGRLLASAYPRREAALAALTARQVAVLVNLHARRHDPALLAKHGLREVHLPVRDFTPPAPEQIDQAVAAIDQALAAGERVAVHCGAGLGRTGTVIACYLVAQGHDPAAAIAEIRRQRPGSVETATQAAAVTAYAARLAQG